MEDFFFIFTFFLKTHTNTLAKRKRKNMMKVLLLATSALLAHSLRLRKPMVNEDGESVIQATIGDIDGLPNEDPAPIETVKPKYTEFFSSDNVEEEDETPRKTYKPEYKAPGPAQVETSVTKGFCAQILEDIENKKAPYFVNGEFTGEMRDDLVEQCGATICTWGQQYRELVQEHTCDGKSFFFFFSCFRLVTD